MNPNIFTTSARSHQDMDARSPADEVGLGVCLCFRKRILLLRKPDFLDVTRCHEMDFS